LLIFRVSSSEKRWRKIIYDLDACEELLKDTYGITVYQGNALSQNWQISKGDADVLRKAMGKSKRFLIKWNLIY
jgi:DNA polymerase III alpha subunit